MRFLAVFVLSAMFVTCAAGLWWLLPARPRFTLPVGNQEIFAGFSPDGQTVATLALVKKGNLDLQKHDVTFSVVGGPVRLWDVNTGRERCQFADGWYVNRVLFSPDSKLAAVLGYRDGQCAIWDTANGQQRLTVATRGQEVQPFSNFPPDVALSSDGRSLAVISPDGDLQLWDLSTGRLRTTVADVRCFALAPDGKTIAAAEHFLAGYQVVTLREVATGDVRKTLAGLVPYASTMAFSADGRHLAVGTFAVFRDRQWGELQPRVQRWSIETGQPEAPINMTERFPSGVENLHYGGDGSMLMTGHRMSSVLWDVASNPPKKVLDLVGLGTLNSDATLLACEQGDPINLMLAMVFRNSQIKLVDLPSWRERSLGGSSIRNCTPIGFSPDSKVLVVSKRNEVGPVALAPWLADVFETLSVRGAWTFNVNGTFVFVDVATRRVLGTAARPFVSYGTYFAPDGRTVAFNDWSGQLWDRVSAAPWQRIIGLASLPIGLVLLIGLYRFLRDKTICAPNEAGRRMRWWHALVPLACAGFQCCVPLSLVLGSSKFSSEF